MHRVFKSQSIRVSDNKINLEYDDSVSVPLEEEVDTQDEVIDDSVKFQMEIDKITKETEEYCKDILEKAKKDKDLILAQAKLEAEKIKSIAYDEGYKLGFDDGIQKANNDIESTISEAIYFKNRAKEEFDNVVKVSEKAISDLVMDILKLLINDDYSFNKEYILGVISKAFEKLNYSSSAIIRVSEEDYDIVDKNKRRVLAMADRVDNLEIISDLSLSKGDCIVETPSGSVNASLGEQLSKIQEIIDEIISR